MKYRFITIISLVILFSDSGLTYPESVRAKLHDRGGSSLYGSGIDSINKNLDYGLKYEKDVDNHNIINDLETKLYGDLRLSCPLAEEVNPCVCSIDDVNSTVLDCSAVQSEDELSAVFQNTISVTDYNQFVLSDNPNIRHLNNSLNGYTFQRIILINDENLELVTNEFLMDSVSTLSELHIHGSLMNINTFPFDSVSLYPNLQVLRLDYSDDLTSIPQLASTSLHEIDFYKSGIVSLESGTFNQAPSLEIIDLRLNKLSSLLQNSFSFTATLEWLFLASNEMTSIASGAFDVPGSDTSTNETLYIILESNQLSIIEPGTFVLTDRPTYIELSKNQIIALSSGSTVLPQTTVNFRLELRLADNSLTVLDEAALGEVFPYITNLEVSGNPLDCLCDFAWLVLEPTYLIKLDPDATCANGTSVHELNPTDYASC